MRIIFLADKFLDEFTGGAELSLQSHIDTCPHDYIKIKCEDFRGKVGADDFVILGNFEKLDKSLFGSLKRYAVIESDYKYCKYRSSHLHRFMGKECDCPDKYSKDIIALFMGASHIFWKAEAQRNEYCRLFPELEVKENTIISGVFTEPQLKYILSLKNIPQDNKYFILHSGSWIKGYRETLAYCVKNNLPFREVKGKPYNEVLRLMAMSKGIVYLPNGFDTACRMITEMKLLGREIITNSYCQHTKEEWFNSGEEGMLKFLGSRNNVFWEKINEYITCPA